MLDPKLVRSDPESIAHALARRGFELDVDHLKDLENRRRASQERTQKLQSERNAYAKSMGKAIAEAKARGEDIEPLKAKGEALKNECHAAEAELESVQHVLEEYLLGVPNLPDDAVPAGGDESDNVELRGGAPDLRLRGAGPCGSGPRVNWISRRPPSSAVPASPCCGEIWRACIGS